MGIYNDYYSIIVRHNGIELEFDPNIYSFALSDSIYNLYNTGKITFHDYTGLVQEYLGSTEGNKITIDYGNTSLVQKSKWVVTYDQTDEFDYPGLLAGKNNIHLVNDWANEQRIFNQGFKDRISNIIRNKLINNIFQNYEIDDTGNEDYWLQCNQSHAQFIMDTLLPNAYSVNANKTPFFAFITNDNYFNFKNLFAMVNEDIVASIDYVAEPGSFSDYKGNLYIVQALNRWHKNMMETWQYRNREIYRIKRSDGTLDIQTDSIKDYPPNEGRKITVVASHSDPTSYLDLGFNEDETGRKENLLGNKAMSLRDACNLDYMMITLPFNPLYKSGKLVQLNIKTKISGDEKLSPVYSGKYLIEHCEQIWNGPKSTGYSKLLLGKKYVVLPNSYLLKPSLI